MAIVTEYKRLGGQYKPQRGSPRYEASKKTKSNDGLKRWLKERWIVVTPYLLNGKVIPCGNVFRRKHACRPLVRVSAQTPPTIREVLNKHGKDKMLQLARTKKRYGSEQVRLNWLKANKTLKRN
jgi:hypothetical protein